MMARNPSEQPPAPPSRMIAEALVERQGPCQIVTKAATLGLSRQLTRVILVACGATAVDANRIASPRQAVAS